MDWKTNSFIALVAAAGGAIGYYFSPSPRQYVGYLFSAMTACLIGWVTAHASRLDFDHQLLLALVVGISSNKMLDHFLVEIWKRREATTIIHTGNNSQFNQGNVTTPNMENKDVG